MLGSLLRDGGCLCLSWQFALLPDNTVALRTLYVSLKVAPDVLETDVGQPRDKQGTRARGRSSASGRHPRTRRPPDWGARDLVRHLRHQLTGRG